MEIENKSKEEHIQEAREFFEDLKNGTALKAKRTDTSVWFIEENLKKAGVGIEALYPEGEKSKKEIKSELKEAVKNGFIREARQQFERLKQPGEGSATLISRAIERNLLYAGVGVKALDPEGKKPSKEIKKEISEYIKAGLIEESKEFIGDIKKDKNAEDYFGVSAEAKITRHRIEDAEKHASSKEQKKDFAEVREILKDIENMARDMHKASKEDAVETAPKSPTNGRNGAFSRG